MLLSVWLLVPAALFADDSTSRYFEELRRRRLFVLAESYCLDRLTNERLPPATRAELVLELSRTFAEHAKFTTGEEQAKFWTEAARTLDDFLAANPRTPQRLRLEVQGALIPAARGEFLRWRSELSPDSLQRRQQARTALDEAVSRSKALEETLAERLGRQRQNPQQEPLPAHQLRTMWYNVRFRLGASLLDLAKVLPPGSADRASHLLDARELLQRLAGGLPREAMTLHSRVLLAECDRLRGDLEPAMRRLDQIIEDKPPKNVLDRAVAERARVLLADKQPTAAAQTLLAYGRQGGLSGELRYLNVQSLIALWEIAEDRNESETAAGLLKQIESRVERADREIGGYWGHRCRLLSQSAAEMRQYGVDLAPVVRKARAAYGEGRIDEAIERYGNAAKTADRDKKPQRAVELGYTRASIQLEAKQYEQAAESFRELALRFPTEKQAVRAHLLWAYCLGKLYDGERTKQRRQAYAAALAAHREKFADDPTAHEATWLLARLEETAGQVTRALTLFHEIPATDRHGLQAQAGAARCYERVLELLRESQQDTDAWERAAVDRLGEIVASFPPEPNALSREQAEVGLRLARIRLNRVPPESAEADRLLERVFSTWQRISAGRDPADKALPAAWKPLLTTATQLRIIALAGRPGPGPTQAARLIHDLSESSTAEVLGVLDGLAQLAKYTDETTRRSLGEVQLQAAEALNRRRSEMDAPQRRRLDHCRAQAYLATDQPRRAIEVYEALVEQSPRDKTLRRTVAELLMQRGTAEFLEKAKLNWRKLETLEKAGSPRWLDARYHHARCWFDLEQYDECRKLLSITKLLYPDLGGNDLRTRFRRLENDLQAVPNSR